MFSTHSANFHLTLLCPLCTSQQNVLRNDLVCVRENREKQDILQSYAVSHTYMTVCTRSSAGVQVCVRVPLGCVDALQNSGIVPIVEKVRGLFKNA